MSASNKYLQMLQKNFPTIEKAAAEIINLEAILNLPKGTEHFVSDLHGEYEAFQHVLRNGSGNVREKIKACFAESSNEAEITKLATLVYYPEEVLEQLKEKNDTKQLATDWYTKTIHQLVELIRFASSKYTRSKVRKALPPDFAYVLEELLYPTDANGDKKAYYAEIIQKIIQLEAADRFIKGMCFTIQRLVVDHLHVVGDIYDRGPAPDQIMETLIHYHSVDIQWGNHDIVWIGAAAGSPICIANVIRICARYGNLDILEDTYGINLRPLLTLATHYYQDNPAFRPKIPAGHTGLEKADFLQITQIHQAAAILQFKLETALIKRRPEFRMDHRRLLEKVNYEELSIQIKDEKYPLENSCFATINPESPEELLPDEAEVLGKLVIGFQQAEKLHRHTDFLMSQGSLYLQYNGNLLLHGCLPLEKDGQFKALQLQGKTYAGKALLDIFESSLRSSYTGQSPAESLAEDLIWYLWTGSCSSLFGKEDMTTFERYFIQDKTTHTEVKNPYYSLRNQEEICRKILAEFELDPDEGHIINGHTPVKEINGENPVKANGKLIVIDGGFSKAYQKTTGIAGYTLLSNSYGMQLIAHQAFTSQEDAIQNGYDILSLKRIVDRPLQRKCVCDTNIGQKLKAEIADLQQLIHLLQSKHV